MIVEQRTYTLHPGALPELLDTYEREGMAVHRRILGNMIGYFYTEIGPLNQIVHLWGYDASTTAPAAAPSWRRTKSGRHTSGRG